MKKLVVMIILSVSSFTFAASKYEDVEVLETFTNNGKIGANTNHASFKCVYRSVNSDDAKSILSVLLTAQTTGKRVTMYLQGGQTKQNIHNDADYNGPYDWCKEIIGAVLLN